MNEKELKWRWWPKDNPSDYCDPNKGLNDFIVRGVGGCDNKLHYYMVQWIECDEYDLHGWYYNGNPFMCIPSNEFHFITAKDVWNMLPHVTPEQNV